VKHHLYANSILQFAYHEAVCIRTYGIICANPHLLFLHTVQLESND